MSIEVANSFIEAAFLNEELRQKIITASPRKVKAIAKKAGFKLSDEYLEMSIQAIKSITR